MCVHMCENVSYKITYVSVLTRDYKRLDEVDLGKRGKQREGELPKQRLTLS